MTYDPYDNDTDYDDCEDCSCNTEMLCPYRNDGRTSCPKDKEE